MTTITTARHQIAIAGKVTDGLTGKAMPGVNVAMTTMPAAFERKLALCQIPFEQKKWNALLERPDRTLSRVDGMFYFLDLPEGDYDLAFSLPGCGDRYGSAQREVKVVHDANGAFKLDWADVGLPATSVKGGITSKKVNVSFAKVRVQGSGESAYSDDAGQYAIYGIEPGKRTLLVYARGYRPISQAVSIEAPGDAQTVNFNLLRDAE